MQLHQIRTVDSREPVAIASHGIKKGDSQDDSPLLSGSHIAASASASSASLKRIPSFDRDSDDDSLQSLGDPEDSRETHSTDNLNDVWAQEPAIETDTETERDSIELLPSSTTVYLSTLTAALGGLLFGYDTGIISGILLVLSSDLSSSPSSSSSLNPLPTLLSTTQKEILTALTPVGALLGSLIGGWTSDSRGRKAVLYLSSILFISGSLLGSLSSSIPTLGLGRFILGVGVGSAALVVPVYIVEIAPGSMRTRLLVVESLGITGGQVCAYLVAIVCLASFPPFSSQSSPSSPSSPRFSSLESGGGIEGGSGGGVWGSGGWRIMMGLGVVPAIVLLALLPTLPESPRYLVSKDAQDEARQVLKRIWPDATPLHLSRKLISLSPLHPLSTFGLIDENTQSPQKQTQTSILTQLLTQPGPRRALILSCSLMALQQLSGFNALMYYSPTLLSSHHFRNPLYIGLLISILNFLGTAGTGFGVGWFGRRRVLLWSLGGMVLALFCIAGSWPPLSSFPHPSTLGMPKPQIPGMPKTQNLNESEGQNRQGHRGALITSIMAFVILYSSGLGTIPWSSPDFFSTTHRATATTLLTLTNWLFNILISSSFLSILEAIGGGFGWFVVAVIAGLGWFGCLVWYPELGGLNLEDGVRVFESL